MEIGKERETQSMREGRTERQTVTNRKSEGGSKRAKDTLKRVELSTTADLHLNSHLFCSFNVFSNIQRGEQGDGRSMKAALWPSDVAGPFKDTGISSYFNTTDSSGCVQSVHQHNYRRSYQIF